MIDLEEVQLALRAKLTSIAELPLLRAWEMVEFTPSATVPSVSEEMGGVAPRLISGTAASGHVATTGLYIIKLYSIAGTGDEDIRTVATAILFAFPFGAATTLASGVTLRIEGEGGYEISQILPIEGTKSQCTVTIPWLAYSQNAAVLSLTA